MWPRLASKPTILLSQLPKCQKHRGVPPLSCFGDMVSGNPGWSRTPYISEDEFIFLKPLPPCLVFVVGMHSRQELYQLNKISSLSYHTVFLFYPFKFCVYEYFECMNVHVPHACPVLQESRREQWIPWNWSQNCQVLGIEPRSSIRTASTHCHCYSHLSSSLALALSHQTCITISSGLVMTSANTKHSRCGHTCNLTEI